MSLALAHNKYVVPQHIQIVKVLYDTPPDLDSTYADASSMLLLLSRRLHNVGLVRPSMVSSMGDGCYVFCSTSPQLEIHPWWDILTISGGIDMPTSCSMPTIHYIASPTISSLSRLPYLLFFLYIPTNSAPITFC